MGLGWLAYLVTLFLLLTLAIGAYSSAPWVPTRKRERDAIIEAVPLAPRAKVFDLGCGDGAMLFALADRYPGLRAVGYDIALPPLIVGWIRRALGGTRYANVSLRWGDLYARDVRDADLVFAYLMPKVQEKLRIKLARELRDDAIVVSSVFPITSVKHERRLGGEGGVLPVYVYRGADLRKSNPAS